MQDSPRTLAVQVGPHLAYAKFAEAIGATPFTINNRLQRQQPAMRKAANLMRAVWSMPGGYDTYFTEGCYYYPALARRLGRIRGKIINVCCTPVFYHLLQGRIGGMERRMLLELARDIDGYVLEGNYIAQTLRSLGIERPSCTAYTFIEPARYAALRAIKPRLDSNEVAIIATNDYHYKGVDILLQAFGLARRENPKLKLNLILRNISVQELSPWIGEGVRISSGVEEGLRTAALYVHPARGDVFPMAPLEAMLTGIPAIVSKETGTEEIIRNVEPGAVVDLDPEAVARRILDYFGLTAKERSVLSGKYRKAALPFNEKEQVARFRKGYQGLLMEMEGGS